MLLSQSGQSDRVVILGVGTSTNSITTTSEQYKPPNRAAPASRFFFWKQSGVGSAKPNVCPT
jgi:hypothetical protein